MSVSRSEAIKQLWDRGLLWWKLDGTQKELYNTFQDAASRTVVWSCARRLGKSYSLCLIAIEQCLKTPNSIVKYVAPQQKMVKMIIRPILREILEDCPKNLRPKFYSQDNVWRFPNGSEIQLAGTDNGNAENLRGGNCLEENTLILTPTGPVQIKDIKKGDLVYGYNKDGSYSITPVKDVWKTGEKQVTEFVRKHNILGACTDEHRWLVKDFNNSNRHGIDQEEIEFSKIGNRHQVITRYPDIPCGLVEESHAYVIGAFLGDGCRQDTGNRLELASQDNQIPDKITSILGIPNRSTGSYKWEFSTTFERYKHSDVLGFNYYSKWIARKYSYEKSFDWDVVNTWNRKSCLALLAGILDTDGNVYASPSEHNIEIQFTTTSEEMARSIQLLIFKLFQFRATISLDSRIEKYTTGKCFKVKIRNTFFSKRALKELTPHLVLERKKYLSKYDDIRERGHNKSTKITKGRTFTANTYDLEVDNETHLYLTADGLVTHNSHLCIVDEAGFCQDLEYLVNSILLPTMTTTFGKIILASTPPTSMDHSFIDYIKTAQMQGSFIKKTLYDNPRISREQADAFIEELGGIDSPTVQREYFCNLLVDSSRSVIPEFTIDNQAITVKAWPRPPYFDAYTAMDIGHKDLTIVLFAYYDFKNDKLIIEDEYDINGPEMTTDKLALEIKSKELALWRDPFGAGHIKPYIRVSDNNLIMINDLQKLHNLTFTPTAKDNADAALNHLRMMIGNGKIIINPRCKNLIAHLQNGTWNRARTSYDRAVDPLRRMHHYDAIDALKYLVRNVVWTKNPYPAGYNGPRGDSFTYKNGRDQYSPLENAVRDIYTVKSTLRRPKQ